MKINLSSVIATVLVLAAATAAYGVDYYVDANNGNDAWDGTTAAIPDQATVEAGGTIAGPRKTLHAMMSDTRVVAGDAVGGRSRSGIWPLPFPEHRRAVIVDEVGGSEEGGAENIMRIVAKLSLAIKMGSMI